jgi:glycosyltransferase involved in cell wall biosynthesis
MPQISVIVPVFNAAAFLQESIGSVLAHTSAAIEVICIDDGSTDGSADLVERLAAEDGRVRLLRLGANRGASAARNAGIALASSDYVFFLDADDEVPPGALDCLLAAARKSGCELVMGKLLWFSTQAQSQGDSATLRSLPGGSGGVFRVDDVSESMFLQSVPGCHCCNLYSRRLLDGHGIRYAADLTFGEDQLFQAAAIVHAGRVAIVDEVVYVYHHYRGQSLTRRPPGLKNLLDDIEFQRRIARLFEGQGLADAGLRFLGSWSYSIRQYWLQIPATLTRAEVGEFFAAFRSMLGEFGVEPWNERTPAHHRHLLGLIMDGCDELALRFLASDQARD